MALVRRDWLEFPDLWRRFFDGEGGGDWLRVEEFVDGKTLVIRAELPGIDPDKDVELTVSDGVLQIQAKREQRSEKTQKGLYRSEFRYGSFTRSVPLPSGTTQSDVQARYSDGILEIRVPVPDKEVASPARIPISRD